MFQARALCVAAILAVGAAIFVQVVSNGSATHQQAQWGARFTSARLHRIKQRLTGQCQRRPGKHNPFRQRRSCLKIIPADQVSDGQRLAQHRSPHTGC